MASDGAGVVDLTRLPVGDGKLSTSAAKGFLWACRTNPEGGGAQVKGLWFNADGTTYNLLAKVEVSGEVSWPANYVTALSPAERVLTTNDLPPHTTGTYPIASTDAAYPYDRNPNSIQSKSITIRLPLNPTLSALPSCAPPTLGILSTGVLLFNAVDAPGRDAVAHETQDSCQGHPQATGQYHYHNVSTCVIDKRSQPSGHSDLVGYLLDGFGIFGRYGENGQMLTTKDLDECHGHTHDIVWDGQGRSMYHYHATWDFPYTAGCLRGTVSQSALQAVMERPTGGLQKMPPK